MVWCKIRGCQNIYVETDTTKITFFEGSPPSDILSDIYSDILSGILSGILSDILPDILSDISAGILPDTEILSGILLSGLCSPRMLSCIRSSRHGLGPCLPRLLQNSPCPSKSRSADTHSDDRLAEDEAKRRMRGLRK